MSKRAPEPMVVTEFIGDHADERAAVPALRDLRDPRRAAAVLRALGARGVLHTEFATALADYLALVSVELSTGRKALRPGVPSGKAIRARYKWFHDVMLQLRTHGRREADGTMEPFYRTHRASAVALTASELKISESAVRRAINPQKK